MCADITIPASPAYTWHDLLRHVGAHRKALLIANVVALCSVLASIPLPLLMPLMVDEVLLNKPGTLIATMQAIFPPDWYGPALYIGMVLLVTVLLRFIAIAFGVVQTRQFTLIAKDIIFRLHPMDARPATSMAMASRS